MFPILVNSACLLPSLHSAFMIGVLLLAAVQCDRKMYSLLELLGNKVGEEREKGAALEREALALACCNAVGMLEQVWCFGHSHACGHAVANMPRPLVTRAFGSGDPRFWFHAPLIGLVGGKWEYPQMPIHGCQSLRVFLINAKLQAR